MIETERLIIKSYCKVHDVRFISPELKPFTSLTNLEPPKAENSGFAVYLKSGELVGHIDVTFKRGRFELSVGTIEKYQKHGYMTEAQSDVVPWIVENCETDTFWALLGGISDDVSRKILGRTDFKKKQEGKNEWWVIERSMNRETPGKRAGYLARSREE